MDFLTKFFATPLYVQLSPELISVRDPRSGREFSGPPELAIARTPKPKIVAIGAEARQHAGNPAIQIINPFKHPRTLISDFTSGEQLLKACLALVRSKHLLSVSPQVVMHPRVDPEGGFTQIEIRALREMVLGAGASTTCLWAGRPLSDQELLAGTFPSDGRLLD